MFITESEILETNNIVNLKNELCDRMVVAEKCNEVLINCKKAFGSKTFNKIYEKLKRQVSNDKKADIQETTSEFVRKYFIKLFNNLQGLKSTKSSDKSPDKSSNSPDRSSDFHGFVTRRFTDVDTSCICAFIDSKEKIMSNKTCDSINELLIQTVQSQRIYQKHKKMLLFEEQKYLKFLENLYHHIINVLDQDFRNKKYALFNLRELIKLHREVIEDLQEQKSYETVYLNRLSSFRAIYVYYFTKKNRISNVYLQNYEMIKDFSYFKDKKSIDKVFMRPIIMFFRYVSFFEIFAANAYAKDEELYNHLLSSFKQIAEMANENRRKKEGNDFLESIKYEVENYNLINRNALGDLLYKHSANFIYRKNQRRYLFLVFRQGIALLLVYDNQTYQFLEQIRNSDITKTNLYKEGDLYMLKIVYKAKDHREMFVVPFEEEEKVYRIYEHTKKVIQNGVKTPTEQQVSPKNDNTEYTDAKYADRCADAKYDDNKLTDKKRVDYDNTNEMCSSFSTLKLSNSVKKIEVSADQSRSPDRKDYSTNENSIVIAKIEFVDLLFLVKLRIGEDFTCFKKRVIARIGKHFYPEKQITEQNIDLSHYLDFVFYIRDNNNLYLLESSDDLHAGSILANNRLDIVIESTKEGDRLKFL